MMLCPTGVVRCCPVTHKKQNPAVHRKRWHAKHKIIKEPKWKHTGAYKDSIFFPLKYLSTTYWIGENCWGQRQLSLSSVPTGFTSIEAMPEENATLTAQNMTSLSNARPICQSAFSQTSDGCQKTCFAALHSVKSVISFLKWNVSASWKWKACHIRLERHNIASLFCMVVYLLERISQPLSPCRPDLH